MKFRNDINILRAFAVIFVVLFHFKLLYINNGYIGVDIFFVISGYLMTKILLGKMESATLPLKLVKSFYVARFTRIVPALLLLCIALFIFAYFNIFNIIYQRIVKEIAFALEFLSNIKYYRDVGYFDIAANRKWLLHTWSLSVEMQFYLFYPFILLVAKKLFRLENIKWVVLLLFIASLGSSVYFSYTNSSASYYLLQNRAWQLLAGGLVFLFPLKIKKSNVVQYVTILLLTVFLFLPSFEKSWGGFISIVPIALAMLFLYANSNATFLAKNRVLKYLGLWSYSIYLWHWVIVAGLYYYGLLKEPLYIILGLIISIILGAVSYYTIEQKFKYRNIIVFIIFIITIVDSNFIYKNKVSNGKELNVRFERHDFKTLKVKNKFFTMNRNLNFIDKADISASKNIIIGDSHAFVLRHMLDIISNRYRVNTLLTALPGCGMLELKHTYKSWSDDYCSNRLKGFYSFVKNSNLLKNKTLFVVQVSSSFRHMLNSNMNEALNILSQKFKKVVIVLDVPHQLEIPFKIYLSGSYYEHSVSLKHYLKVSKFVKLKLEKIASKYSNVIVVDPTPYMCDAKRCPVGTKTVSYYAGLSHLTSTGSIKLLPLFEPFFKGKK